MYCLSVYHCLWDPVFTCGIQYLPVESSIYLWNPVFTCGIQYLPVGSSIYLWNPVFTCGIQDLPVGSSIYLWDPGFTRGIQDLPVFYPLSDSVQSGDSCSLLSAGTGTGGDNTVHGQKKEFIYF